LKSFKILQPPINIGDDISIKSFEIIEDELKNYQKAKEFNKEETEVIKRLIHTSSCFDEVLNNILFLNDPITHIKKLLQNKAKIIVDVNMIKVGLSEVYLNRYQNEVICYVNESFIFKKAQNNKTTRSYAAVIEAIKRYKNEPIILACGNAPTFIYAAINTLLELKVDLNNVALVIFPVGFVNVIESKDYAIEFCKSFGVSGVIMKGRFGSSTMSVAVLHAIYKLMKN
jgi:precorrin-8X/cobalt-precorrin-8 methylmutase